MNSKANHSSINNLKHSNSKVRKQAATHLGQLVIDEAVEPLMKSLNDPDEDVRVAVIKALVRIQQQDAFYVVLEKLRNDPSEKVRLEGALSLHYLSNPQATGQLIESLNDPSEEVRAAAVFALIRMNNKQAISPLNRVAFHDGSLKVRKRAVYALSRIGGTDSLPELAQLLLTDGDMSVRSHAAKALGQLGDQQALRYLIAVQNVNHELRFWVVWAFGMLGRKEAIDSLINYLAAKRWWMRAHAAEALGELRAEQAYNALTKLLDDDNSKVRGCAADALLKLKP